MKTININEMQTININEMQTININEPDNQSALILINWHNLWVCGCTFGTGGCWTSKRNAKVHHCFCCSICFWALATLCAENWIWKSHWKPCECCRSEKKSETVCDCNPPRVPLILMALDPIHLININENSLTWVKYFCHNFGPDFQKQLTRGFKTFLWMSGSAMTLSSCCILVFAFSRVTFQRRIMPHSHNH